MLSIPKITVVAAMAAVQLVLSLPANAQTGNICQIFPELCIPNPEIGELRVREFNICELFPELCSRDPSLQGRDPVRVDVCALLPDKCTPSGAFDYRYEAIIQSIDQLR